MNNLWFFWVDGYPTSQSTSSTSEAPINLSIFINSIDYDKFDSLLLNWKIKYPLIVYNRIMITILIKTNMSFDADDLTA